MADLSSQAVQAALKQNWEEAVDINIQLLSDEPENIDTLNRLAFAYRQLGDLKNAKNTYQQVIKLDRFNPIATKNLDKLNRTNSTHTATAHAPVLTTFLEEPGKTKTLSLVNPADGSYLVSLNPGTEVFLVNRKRRLLVETADKHYVGCLPDDLSFKLSRLLSLGYQYQCIIKNTDLKSVTVFIRETQRSKEGNNLPSFSGNSNQSSAAISPTMIEEDPIDITPTGEDESDNS